jgi:hypothetical protein
MDRRMIRLVTACNREYQRETCEIMVRESKSHSTSRTPLLSYVTTEDAPTWRFLRRTALVVAAASARVGPLK